MFRAYSIVAVGIVLLANSAMAQSWTEKLFAKHEHDFGTVARAAKAEYEFKITNNSDKVIHLAGVRTSCGCTTPKITKETLAPGEVGSILAIFNTRTHIGHRAATLTVTFDRPNYTEVQLRIKGYVRQDIVINPGVVRFGTVVAGEPAEKKVTIEYAGRGDWKILEVLSGDENMQVELKDKKRNNGNIAYELAVKLKPEAANGYFSKELTLVTNDRRVESQRIPLLVEGRIEAGVTVSPASLYLGDMQMGEEVTRQFVVRAREPFKIKNVSADNAQGTLKFQADDEAKTLHVVTVTFNPNQPGKLEQKISIETDLEGANLAACTALANVTERASEE
jgi:hypothetical protein